MSQFSGFFMPASAWPNIDSSFCLFHPFVHRSVNTHPNWLIFLIIYTNTEQMLLTLTFALAGTTPPPRSYFYCGNLCILLYVSKLTLFLFQLKKNVLNVDFHIAKYGQIVEELRKEVRIIKLIKMKKNDFEFLIKILKQLKIWSDVFLISEFFRYG